MWAGDLVDRLPVRCRRQATRSPAPPDVSPYSANLNRAASNEMQGPFPMSSLPLLHADRSTRRRHEGPRFCPWMYDWDAEVRCNP
jgi:hypothetical protein